MIVVSTELVAALYVPGALTMTAEAVLQRDASWASPMIWRALLPLNLEEPLRTGRLTPQLVADIVAAAPELFRSREFPAPLADNMKIVLDSGCSALIAPFINLALGLNVRLVTTDTVALRHYPAIAIAPAAFAGTADD